MNGESFNPYPGLRSFEPEEDHLFFGREKQIDDLLRRLRKSRFLSVVGTSGSGKSSVIRSGMIPALYSGMMTRAGSSWRIAIMRPGDDPIGNLAEVLNDCDVLGPEDEDMAGMNRSILETTLRASAVGLADAVRQARIPEHDNVLVLVDQFEELFRFRRNARIRSSRRDALTFVKLLLEASKAEGIAIYIVITMRSDFIGNCMDFPALPEAVNDGQYLIPRMTRDELRMAISGPAAVAGGEMSPRLVRTLLNEVGDNPDQLPILQHCLMRTWDYWQEHHSDGEPVDLEHYNATGTMKEALSRHAEVAWGELSTDREREIAEKLFKALTDKGSDARGVRRPCRLEEVCEQVGAEPAEVVAVAERFRKAGRSFVMPPEDVELDAGSVLDISHESLMRVWARLIEWLEEEGQSAQLYGRLSRAAARHEAGEGGLWGEEELALALPWREKNRPTEAWAGRYDAHFERSMAFLDASKKAVDDLQAARDRRRQLRLRRARQLNWAAVIVAVVVLFFASKMWRLSLEASIQSEIARTQQAYAEVQQKQAESKEREAERERQKAEELRVLALAERAEANEQRERAEQNEQIAQVQRRRALENELQALASAQEAEKARAQAEVLRAEAETHRERAELEKREADIARAQAAKAEAEAQRLRRLAQFRELVFQTVQSGTRNEEVAALVSVQALHLYRQLGSDEEDPDVFDVLRLNAQRLGSKRWDVLGAHRGPARAIAVSADGSRIASGGDDPKVRLFELAGSAEPVSLRAHRSGVHALVFAGQRLAIGTGEGSIRVFDLRERKPSARTVAAHVGAIHALAVRRDALLLVSGGADGDLRWWNLEQPEPLGVRTTTVGSAVRSLAFRGSSGTLAVGGEGGLGLLETDQEGAELRMLTADGVRAVAFSGVDGRLLAAGFATGEIRIWDLDAPDNEPSRLEARGAGVNALSFDPSGRRLASAHQDGNARLWDLANPEVDPLLYTHGADVSAVAFDLEGSAVVTASADRTITLWPIRTAQLAEEICNLVSRNLTRIEWHELLPPESEYQATCPNLPSS